MDSKRYLENWQEEIDSAHQYRAMAAAEPDPRLKRVYANLAKVEEAHVEFWESQMRRVGATTPPRRPSWRSRILAWMALRFGPQAILATVAANEAAGHRVYDNQPETRATRMSSQERWHARILGQLLATHHSGMQGGMLGKLEGRHRAVGGNALRAAVLGANDGLCSNLSLVMGVAGAGAGNHAVTVAGAAGLLAGAFSMALGEWVSVTSSRELAERELRIESMELEMDPKGEGEELQLIYEAKGLSSGDAQTMVSHLLAEPGAALEALSREELGINPDDLGGSAWQAAWTSFVLFSLGAVIPLIPFLVQLPLPGFSNLVASLSLSLLALFGIGAAITVFTGKPVWLSGLRQLALGLAAAMATYGIGRLLGVAVS